jgi:hypothetical protein
MNSNIEKFGFIYFWENFDPLRTRHKFYIGQHIGSEDDGYIGTGVLFKRVWKKTNPRDWKRTILERCDNIDELNDAEDKWAIKYDVLNNPLFCNLKGGGGGRGKLSEESKQKIRDTKRKNGFSQKQMDARNRTKGIPWSDEKRQKRREMYKTGRLKNWMKGLKGTGLIKRKKETIARQCETVRRKTEKIRSEQSQIIVDYIKIHSGISIEEIMKLLNVTQPYSWTIVRYCLHRKLIRKNLILKKYKYILYNDLNTKEIIHKFIKDNPLCLLTELIKFMEKTAGPYCVKAYLTQLRKENKVFSQRVKIKKWMNAKLWAI